MEGLRLGHGPGGADDRKKRRGAGLKEEEARARGSGNHGSGSEEAATMEGLGLGHGRAASSFSRAETNSPRYRGSWLCIDGEEAQAIGEEFIEFLENELKIDDSRLEDVTGNDPCTQFGQQAKIAKDNKTSTNSFDDGLSEIEVALEKLKKELGLG
ncbi:uncharacterized protein [Miscanthus floridulus]|uniref:uncharacterized protein n=1 Tax=Miscanthus floridulus TaxID=154761 RepID=UPI00345B49D4